MAEPLRLVSVHDLMPAKMAAVREVVALLDTHGVAPITFLVCPGFDWAEDEIAWLRDRQQRGDRLAGHGWRHEAGAPGGLYDRLHRTVFSRGVAEHLPLDEDGIAALIQRNYDWFGAQHLAPPTLYVPPAWAMGPISRERLRGLPFRLYETLTGIYDAQDDSFTRVPLVGYEADTVFRAVAVRWSNRVNRLLEHRSRRLRVSIHPTDLQLQLAADLQRTIAEPAYYAGYADVLAAR